nr:integrase, catalytic region, zinc finger, CCHC-type, peptidase aspartic, catalytic [Tanacetum cinerariifolium]
MANLSYDIQCVGSDHDHYQEAACAHHEDHMMHDSVQLDHVVNSHADYTSDSNIILYDQYFKDNEVPVVHSDVSSVPTDAFMMIYDDMCEPHDQSVSYPSRNTSVQNPLTAKLATYKEHVELYEQRAKFELTEREKKINEQLSRVISDRNFKEETLKRELHSIKLQLTSTINHNKSMVEEVSFLKKDFKQKENKYFEDFLDMKSLKEKFEDKLIKQDQPLQTVHMLCRPRPNPNELNRVAIGYKSPLCLTRAKQVQPALYNGHEIIKDNHKPTIVYDTKDTLEIAEITRKKINDKMNDPECVTRKVKIASHDYSKENFLATFTPQKQLTLEQIFWSNDLMKLKSEALKERTKVCLKCDLRPGDWIVDSGCTKHMTGNRRLFTSYKAYDGVHVVFGSNLKGNVVGGGNITPDSITITNVEHVSGLAFNLISVVVTNHSSKFDKFQFGSFCKQHGMSYNLSGSFTSQSSEIVERKHRYPKNLKEGRGHPVEQVIGELNERTLSKAYIVLNNKTMSIEESPNVTFDESLPKPKSSPSVEDDRINEPIVQDLNGSSSLQVNVLDEGYPKNLKEGRGHPVEQVIGELNERTLRSKSKQA